MRQGKQNKQNLEQLISTINDWAVKVTKVTNETKEVMISYLQRNNDASDIISEHNSNEEQSKGEIMV